MGQGSDSISGEDDDWYYAEDDLDGYSHRKPNPTKSVPSKVIKPIRVRTITKPCSHCKTQHTVRIADLNRGWGKFCSKSCKAYNQEHSRRF